MYNPEDPQSLNGGCEIKVTSTGYWKSMDDLRIFTSTPTVGRKTTREFYEGKAPYGNKTRWKMHEYQAEQKTHLGINKEQVLYIYLSSCTWFRADAFIIRTILLPSNRILMCSDDFYRTTVLCVESFCKLMKGQMMRNSIIL